MSSRHADWCDHLLENIERVQTYLGSPPEIAHLETPLIADAVERCLERISEVVSRFHRDGVDLASLEPGIAWRDIRMFGNVIRHEYDQVDGGLIGQTIVNDLPALKAATTRLRKALD